jgi:hypothetical protein
MIRRRRSYWSILAFTNPIDWGQSSLARPQGMSPAQNPHTVWRDTRRPRDQTLPTISLALGILSILLVCCPGGGVLLGLPAAIVGFIALQNIDSNPAKYRRPRDGDQQGW